MCIIIYKEHGIPVLKKNVYKECFDRNPDGAGFAWWDSIERIWRARKGFMSFKHFWKNFNRSAVKFEFEKTNVIVHFRVGTSGNRKGPDCTHPFPITRDYEKMRKLAFKNENIIFHNGVIGAGSGLNSDTMVGVHDYIAPIIPHLEEDGMLSILEELLMTNKCKWIITKGEDIRLLGNWLEDEEYPGYSFSNRSYKAVAKRQSKNSVASTVRMYKHQRLQDFIVGGKWSWHLWEESKYSYYPATTYQNNLTNNKKEETTKEIVTPPVKNEEGTEDIVSLNKLQKYILAPATVVGMLNKDGDIEWEESYSPEDDLLSCPNCGDEETFPYMGEGDSAICNKCSCVFSTSTGAVIMFDNGIQKNSKGQCYCPECSCHMDSDNWGACVKCETVIDMEKNDAAGVKSLEDNQLIGGVI